MEIKTYYTLLNVIAQISIHTDTIKIHAYSFTFKYFDMLEPQTSAYFTGFSYERPIKSALKSENFLTNKNLKTVDHNIFVVSLHFSDTTKNQVQLIYKQLVLWRPKNTRKVYENIMEKLKKKV